MDTWPTLWYGHLSVFPLVNRGQVFLGEYPSLCARSANTWPVVFQQQTSAVALGHLYSSDMFFWCFGDQMDIGNINTKCIIVEPDSMRFRKLCCACGVLLVVLWHTKCDSCGVRF